MGSILIACFSSSDQQRWDQSMRSESFANGVSRTYPAGFARTIQAAENALVAAGLNQERNCPDIDTVTREPHCVGLLINPVDDHTSYLYAIKGNHGWNGEQVRVLIQRLGPELTTVRVISKYREQTILGRRGDYSRTILDEIARNLK
jgi:hypothetical protein